MKKNKIYFTYAWHGNPAGGALATCRAVKALNNRGYDAILMYKCDSSDPMPLIECSNEIPRMRWNPDIINKDDVLVICEIDGPYLSSFDKSITKVIFNQSPALMFAFQCLSLETLHNLYNSNNNVTDMIVVSQHALDILSPFIPEVRVHRIRHNPEFSCGKDKKFQIAYFPFKCPNIKDAILKYFPDVPTVCVDFRPHKEVEKILQESLFFLDWSDLYYEGFGLSAFEAMASGCVLFCNMWPAGKEFMKPEFSCLVDTPHDWQQIIPLIQQIMEKYKSDPNSVVQMGIEASNFIHDNYSEKKFEDDLEAVFNPIMN